MLTAALLMTSSHSEGTLPSSIARAKTLTRVSFNLNQFSGKIPPGICNTPAGDGPNTPDVAHDCRIGADTDYAVYVRSKSPLATENQSENTDGKGEGGSEHPISGLSGWQPATFYLC